MYNKQMHKRLPKVEKVKCLVLIVVAKYINGRLNMWTETNKADWKTPEELGITESFEWWQLLDWSHMENTFKRMANEELKQRILNEGYWSLGKGCFYARSS